MYTILVVEDSSLVRKILAKLIGGNPYFRCILCANIQEAKMELARETFFAAVVDLKLPDAPEGEVVDLTLEYDIPTIVLTGNFDGELRSDLLDKGVLDYITKGSRFAYMQVVKVLDRLRRNITTKVLVVDDSKAFVKYMCNLLEKFQFQVVSAADGEQALAKIDKEPDIKLVITDYYMPNMDGCDLVRALRLDNRFQDLVVIGLSSTGDGVLSARFIKSGANDFLKKPFYHEEFYWRVFHNLEAMEMLETIRESANLDPLTGIYNRRYLFDYGDQLFEQSREGDPFVVLMVDIDKFKVVNDTLGHKVGDQLIMKFAKLLEQSFSSDLVGRYGGEEFVVVARRSLDDVHADLGAFMQRVRTAQFTEQQLSATCSVGVCMEAANSLSASVEVADANLYVAKANGRDRVEPFDSMA